jgi:hypothetical protein
MRAGQKQSMKKTAVFPSTSDESFSILLQTDSNPHKESKISLPR